MEPSTSSNSFSPRHSQSFKRQGQGSRPSSEGSDSESAMRSFSHYTPPIAACTCCGIRHLGDFIVNTTMCHMCGGTGHYACIFPSANLSESYTSGSGYGRGSNSDTQSYDST
ncbi:hypothetical protein ACFXTH_047133 [Malus domestica]